MNSIQSKSWLNHLKRPFRTVQQVKNYILKFWFIFILPNMAFADSLGDGDDTVTTVVTNICGWLSGAPAIAVGVLAVIYSGYEMMHGEIDKNKFIIRCAGIGLIIGGSTIAKNIIMQGIIK